MKGRNHHGTPTHQEVDKIEDDTYGELAYAFGALALHFSKYDKLFNNQLRATDFHMVQTKVVQVQADYELRNALIRSSMNKFKGKYGERHVVLIRDGVYHIL